MWFGIHLFCLFLRSPKALEMSAGNPCSLSRGRSLVSVEWTLYYGLLRLDTESKVNVSLSTSQNQKKHRWKISNYALLYKNVFLKKNPKQTKTKNRYEWKKNVGWIEPRSQGLSLPVSERPWERGRFEFYAKWGRWWRELLYIILLASP